MNDSSAIEALAPALLQLAALATEPTITRAAARSGTSQPTLSRSLRRWEERLGFQIVVPRGRGVDLTADGRALAAAAAEVVRGLGAAVASIRGEQVRRPFTVGFLRSLGPTVVGELVSSFLRDHPDVVVAHRETSTSGAIEALDAGDVDVAVTAPRPPARFHWLPLGTQAFTLMVPGSHLLAERSSVRLEEVKDERFLALDSRYHARSVADALCVAAGFVARIAVEADDIVTVANYVGAGLGVAILPADSSVHRRTVSVPISDPGASREFGLAWASPGADAGTRAFAEHARALGERYPKWADIDL